MYDEYTDIFCLIDNNHQPNGHILTSRTIIDLRNLYSIDVNKYLDIKSISGIDNNIIQQINTEYTEILLYKILINTLTDPTILLSNVVASILNKNSIPIYDINLPHWSVITQDVTIFKHSLLELMKRHNLPQIVLKYDDIPNNDYCVIQNIEHNIMIVDIYELRIKYENIKNKYSIRDT